MDDEKDNACFVAWPHAMGLSDFLIPQQSQGKRTHPKHSCVRNFVPGDEKCFDACARVMTVVETKRSEMMRWRIRETQNKRTTT